MPEGRDAFQMQMSVSWDNCLLGLLWSVLQFVQMHAIKMSFNMQNEGQIYSGQEDRKPHNGLETFPHKQFFIVCIDLIRHGNP
jgi:hypothetical protein